MPPRRRKAPRRAQLSEEEHAEGLVPTPDAKEAESAPESAQEEEEDEDVDVEEAPARRRSTPRARSPPSQSPSPSPPPTSSPRRRQSSSPPPHSAFSPAGPSPQADDGELTAPPPPRPQRPTRLHYRPSLILRGHKRGVSAVKFSPDGRWIASSSADASVKIWDAHTGKLQHTLEGHLAGVSAIAWSSDSQTVASGSDDKSIRLWHAVTGKPHGVPFRGHHNYVYSVCFSPKGNMLVSGSYDEAVFVWDVRAARVMRSLPAHSDPVSGVAFVRDGTLIVSCAGDGLIRIWDTASGQCLRTLVHEDNAPVTSVQFSPNGKFVLAWTLDSCVRLWNYVEGRVAKTYQAHVNQTYSLAGAFGVYGKDAFRKEDEEMRDGGEDVGGDVEEAKWAFVVSGSEDGALLLWDVSSKDVLQQLSGHDGPVLCVDTHPMERRMVSAGLDKTVRVWTCDEDGEEYDEAEATVDEAVLLDGELPGSQDVAMEDAVG